MAFTNTVINKISNIVKVDSIQKYFSNKRNKTKLQKLIKEDAKQKRPSLFPGYRNSETRINIPKPKNIFGKKKWNEFTFFSYVSFSIKQQTFFAKRLSFLIRSGVPMLESMHVLKAQASGRSEAKVLDKIINDVANGQTLSSSLAKFRNVFGAFTINVIKAGEASGTLIQNLNYLADELKKRSMLRKKIKSALVYPVIITIATFGLTGFLTVYIFPKIMPIFQSMSVELPFTTRTLIWLSALIKNHGLLIFAVIVVLVVSFLLLKKFLPRVRYAYDGFILRLPIFGSIAKNYNLTNTMRTMGILLKSSMTLTEALLITADTTENVRYKAILAQTSIEVMKGRNMSQTIEKFKFLFPPMTTHLLTIGEKSGNMSNTFVYLSEYYEHEFDEQTKNLSSTIEPVLMIIMGIMVGFVAVSIITPIYELTGSISR